MGVYCYTLRAETVKAGDRAIGRYGYAYKESFWRESAAYNRRVALMHAHADRAVDKNPKLRYAVVGEFKDTKTQKLPVYDVINNEGYPLSCFSDGRAPGPLVGYLSKDGREYVFEAVVQ